MGESTPDISIVIPVLYETDTIGETLDHVHRMDTGGRCEVIVVDGDPDGGTIKSIRHPDVVTRVSRPWRSRQMNVGAAVATGKNLLFLHADTLLPVNFVTDIDRALRGNCQAGAFRHKFDSNRFVYRVMSCFVNIRTRLGNRPLGDQAIFVRRSFFNQIGGYKEIPIMEDVEIVRRIRRSGGRLAILDTSIRTSCRRLESEGIAKRVCQNCLMTVMYSVGVSPEKLVKYYTEDYRK